MAIITFGELVKVQLFANMIAIVIHDSDVCVARELQRPCTGWVYPLIRPPILRPTDLDDLSLNVIPKLRGGRTGTLSAELMLADNGSKS